MSNFTVEINSVVQKTVLIQLISPSMITVLSLTFQTSYAELTALSFSMPQVNCFKLSKRRKNMAAATYFELIVKPTV